MSDHEIFDQQKEVNSFAAHKARLSTNNPQWTGAELHKQALINFNTIMLSNQVKTYLSEKRGDKIGHVDQEYLIIGDDLIDPYFGPFQSMIDHASTEGERNELADFRSRVLAALPGEEVCALDMSGLRVGRGIRYFDTYEKGKDGIVRHKERVDFAEDGRDFSYEAAKEILLNLDLLSPQPAFEQFQPTSAILFAGSVIPYPAEIVFSTKLATPLLQVPTAAAPDEKVIPPAVPEGSLKTGFTGTPESVSEAQVVFSYSDRNMKILPRQEQKIEPQRTERQKIEQRRMGQLRKGQRITEQPKAEKGKTEKRETKKGLVAETVLQKKEPPVYIVVPLVAHLPTDEVPSKKPIENPLRLSGVIPAKTVFVRQKQSAVIYQLTQARAVTVVFPVRSKQTPILPPDWKVSLEPLNDKEILLLPRVIGDDSENNEALVLVVVTTFFLIANTVWRRQGQTFFSDRGSSLSNF